nr:S8 family serine peptidase [Halovivax limisalsi]
MNRRTILKAAGGAGAALGLGGIVSATPGREPGPKEDEILVGVADDTALASVRSTVTTAVPDDASIVHENETLEYVAVRLADDEPRAMESTIERLERQPGVEYAEPNVTRYPLERPNDPGFDQQYAPQQVRADQAWNTEVGSMDVTIAVIDQGVQYDHDDLADRFQGGNGYDFVDRDGDPYPAGASENHGTHVSGCAAATTGNGAGTAGISNCRLISGRALGNGGGSMGDIADAIQWAADQGADIINMSLGGAGPSQTGRRAINYAFQNGALPIAAAGNDGGSVSYPAAYQNCVAVSAIDENENLASFSNRGPEINVAAPGVDVLAPVPFGEYETMSGTSMACPVASGVAALGKSANPNLSPQQLWNLLEQTAVDIGLPPRYQGAGRVDALNIVGGDGGGGDPGDCGEERETASADGELSGGWWGDSDTYSYSLRTSNPCEATVSISGPSNADFDLYLTLDGREPTTSDYDEASRNQGSQESITVDLTGNEELGLLVDAYSGSGSYTIQLEELGK